MNGTLESLKSLVTSLDDAKLDSNTGGLLTPLLMRQCRQQDGAC